jgi:uncharacterized protein YpmS
VFSIGYGIIAKHTSWVTLGWLIVVFILVAMIFVLSLQVIIRRLRSVRKGIDQIFIQEITGTSVTQIPTTKD